ncbi:ATP-dependent helicase, partial [Brucella sp. 10RB9212]
MAVQIGIDYDPVRIRGVLSQSGDGDASSIWERIKARFASRGDVILIHDTLDLPWPEVLGVIREFGSASTQKALGFKFVPSDRAREKVATFV